MKSVLQILIILFLSSLVYGQNSYNGLKWEKVDEGLFLAEFVSPIKSEFGNNLISILKINPQYYNFNLFSANKDTERMRTAKRWAESKDLIAVFNAGMFQPDFKSEGYMKDYDFSYNPKMNSDNAILAFNPIDSSVPEIQIIDRKCQDWNVLKNKYNSLLQSIRMVDCTQKNRWSQQNKKWSMVIVAIDKEENVLFIFTRSPYTVHNFVNTLLDAPLNLYNAMYLEGGPEASFYLNHNEIHIEKMGSYETNFYESDDNTRFWKLPNIIGITKK